MPSTSSRPGAMSPRRSLPVLVAAAAAPLALATPAAHAATSTWRVTTTADTSFKSTADVTLRTAAGATLFTCAGAGQYGSIPKLTSAAATPVVIKTGNVIGTCADSHGTRSTFFGGTPAFGTIGYTATGYNATTGTSTLTGANTDGIPITVAFSTADCAIYINKIAATYTNSTHTLKLTSGTVSRVSAGCFAGTVKVNDTLVLTGDFKMDPAVTITRTTT
ncbi:hypothetical protein [Actinomadura napierensis]|uniref:Uncharacterized protein n=1 Tax=Actinomadura napierensis TaxID=267854 RepID=A0ABN3AL80_9ACTN